MREQEIVARAVAASARHQQPGFNRVHIIVNPASGADKPVLSILNDVFQSSKVEWEIFVTKDAGDARRYAEASLQAGVDVVGVYGGDGTVMEVASALVGKPTPLAIFPGGTANVMSVELGVPSDLAEACALVTQNAGVVRAIDVGQFRDSVFLTRVGMGLESTVIESTAREQKDRMGWLAYALNTLRELSEPKVSHYEITLDGERISSEGLMCVVANSGILSPNSGIPGAGVVAFAPNISVSDGLLDVVVIRRGDLGSLLAVAASMVRGAEDAEPMQHWQARQVVVDAEPRQTVQLDGEIVGETPIEVRVLPQALRVVVPQAAEPPTATREDFEAADQSAPPPGGARTNPAPGPDEAAAAGTRASEP